jgi:hypothetical protein
MPGLFDKMVCLVGENPLPVYLGIKQLATPEAEVVLVYSEATRPKAEIGKRFLLRQYGGHCLRASTGSASWRGMRES